MIIMLDGGHGGKDSGAVSGKELEKNYNLEIVKEMVLLLQKYEVKVLCTRTEDKYLSLDERCQLANKKKANVFFSVHCNSASNKNAKGFESYCYKTDRKGYELCHNIVSEVAHHTDLRKTPIVTNNSLYVINNTSMTAVLMECDFMSNEEGMKNIKENHKLFAKNFVDGLVKTYKLKKKTSCECCYCQSQK